MKDNYFVLHIGPEHLTPQKEYHMPKKAETPVVSHKHTKKEENIKDVLKNGAKQFLVTLLILVITFLGINYQAYYVILKSYLSEPTQTTQVIKTQSQKILSTDKDIEKQIKEVPMLAMEVLPTDMRLVITRIDQNIPVVRVPSENLIKRDWKALEKDMQDALQNGVVHYPGTSMPDQMGNTVITGHSSYFPWDPGKFKDVFALLHQVVVGDEIVAYYNQHKYIYKVIEKKVVLPTEVEVLKQTPDQRLTLITCTPVGTNLKRLIVVATLVKEEN